MPDRPMVAFPALHLEGNFLLAAEVLDNIHCNSGLRNRGVAHGELSLVRDQQDAIQGEGLARFALQTFHFQGIARGDTILFPASFNHCIHKSYSKREGITPKLQESVNPHFTNSLSYWQLTNSQRVVCQNDLAHPFSSTTMRE